MNYRHIYHAGSFSDVFKHVILVMLIQVLERKETPFCYLDTHAGIGRYDLTSTEAQKTQEFATGIMRLLQHEKNNMPQEIAAYLEAVRAINPDSTTQYYPGSPRIAHYFLRPQDRMILCELHPEEAQKLKQEFYHDKQVAVHLLDGYQGLKAFLPPAEKRGLVLIDPPFESTDEFQQIMAGLQMALQRWATGIYAIWYPLTYRAAVNQFTRQLMAMKLEKILLAELSIYPEDSPVGLNGCGMIIINPPWHLAEQLKPILAWLWQILVINKQGSFKVEWLSKTK